MPTATSRLQAILDVKDYVHGNFESAVYNKGQSLRPTHYTGRNIASETRSTRVSAAVKLIFLDIEIASAKTTVWVNSLLCPK